MRNKEILDSWKDISRYLDRDIRTCYRWEKRLSLPIHRIDNHSQCSRVFAYKSEINQWLKDKANNHEIERKSFWQQRKFITGAVLCSSALAAAVFAFLYFTQRHTPSLPPVSASIAVLPFESVNFSEFDEYFSEGMANEITGTLMMINNLRVIPAESVSRYKDTSKSEKQIARELKVGYILKGRVEKVEDKVRMTVNLIRGKNGRNIWDREFNDSYDKSFHLPANLCQEIIEVLGINAAQNLLSLLNEGRADNNHAFESNLKGNYLLSRSNSNNSDPWKLYYQGKFYSEKWTQESNEIAISLFNQAIKADENYAEPYFGLARCYVYYINFGWNTNKDWLLQAENLVEKAQALCPDHPSYFTVLTQTNLLKEFCFNEDTRESAYTIIEQGIEKYPSHGLMNSLAGYCCFLRYGEKGEEKDFEKALEYMERGFWINPNSIGNISYVELLMLNKEFQRAIGICEHIMQFDLSPISKFRLGEIYYYLGDLEKSRAIFQQFETPLKFKLDSLFYLGMIASQKGETGKVQTILKEINNLASGKLEFFEKELRITSIYLGIGEKELGNKHLISFFSAENAKKFPYLCHRYIDIDRNFDEFRNLKEFKDIIEK